MALLREGRGASVPSAPPPQPSRSGDDILLAAEKLIRATHQVCRVKSSQNEQTFIYKFTRRERTWHAGHGALRTTLPVTFEPLGCRFTRRRRPIWQSCRLLLHGTPL